MLVLGKTLTNETETYVLGVHIAMVCSIPVSC